MLTFFRPSFRSGVMLIKDRKEGKIAKKIFKPSDNGKNFEFDDEDYVMETYPKWFMDETAYVDKKESLKKAKKEKKTIKV